MPATAKTSSTNRAAAGRRHPMTDIGLSRPRTRGRLSISSPIRSRPFPGASASNEVPVTKAIVTGVLGLQRLDRLMTRGGLGPLPGRWNFKPSSEEPTR